MHGERDLPAHRRTFSRIALALGGLATLAGGWLGATSWVWARVDPHAMPAMGPPDGVDSLSAARCGACHVAIHEEWSRSAMGRAMQDPVFLADHRAQGEPFVCLNCHAPLENQQPLLVDGLWSVAPLIPRGRPNPDFDADLQREGVTCVVCHLRDGALVGPHDTPSAPHPTRQDGSFGGVDRCARCHQVRRTPLSNLDRPLPDTVAEWRAWTATTGRTETCVDCHMPPVTRPLVAGLPERPGRRHTWPGGWDDTLVREGLGVEVVDRSPGRVVLALENRAGHRFPTAEPLRAVSVRAVQDGRIVAEARIERRVPLPRLRDEGDTTLAPGETRAITLAWEGDARVQVVWQRLVGFQHAVEAPPAELVLWEDPP